MTQMHYSCKPLLCLRVKDLLVHLQFTFFSNSYLSLSSLSIQHHVEAISGDLEGSSYHLATLSCILTL